jgi:hypothetical protein
MGPGGKLSALGQRRGKKQKGTATISYVTIALKLTLTCDFPRTILVGKLMALLEHQLKKERYYHIMICIAQYSALCVGSK